jgi:hypothetical protein
MNDGGGFWNILPPGQNGHATVADIAAFFAACPPPKTNCPDAPRPKHSSKELQMYGDLVYASPGLSAADIPKYSRTQPSASSRTRPSASTPLLAATT